MGSINSFVEKLSWEDIAPRVKRVSPALYRKIEALNPSKKHALYRVVYPYGAEILKNGLFYLPSDEGNLVSLIDSSMPAHIKDDLSYNAHTNPVMLVLKNQAELFLMAHDRHFPYMMLEPGHLLGAWGVLDKQSAQPPFSIWNLTAGARSLFMLPKISDRVFHERLQREFAIRVDVPRTLSDHWKVFRALANHVSVAEPWSCELLLFSKHWFFPANGDLQTGMRCFLYEKAWDDSIALRNRHFWDFVFSSIHKQNHLAQSAYFFDIIKHLFSISSGSAVAFEPAINESTAPIHLIQNAYVNGGYKLKQYSPIIMIPAALKRAGDGSAMPVYFSTNYLTALELFPKSNNKPSLISDLVKIKNMLIAFQESILTTSEFDFSNNFLHELAKSTQFKFHYIHAVADKEIYASELLPQSDVRFSQQQHGPHNLEFPVHNEFIRGCISIG